MSELGDILGELQDIQGMMITNPDESVKRLDKVLFRLEALTK